MLTEKDYCDYDTCVALKELGYNGSPYECSCFGAFYRNGEDIFYDRLFNSELGEVECLRVPLYLAQKWLREENNIEVNASFDKDSDGWIGFIQRLDYPDLMGTDFLTPVFNSYEEALLEGIKEAIKILSIC